MNEAKRGHFQVYEILNSLSDTERIIAGVTKVT